MSAYRVLDDTICAYLEREPGLHPMYSGVLMLLAAKELGREQSIGDEKEWRLIDRRLQAMRRAGRVQHVREKGIRPRWEVVPK
jgi:hypothetical protein